MCIYDGKVASGRSSSPPHWNEAKGVDIPLPTFRSEESTFMESIVCWTEHEIPATVGVGNECERLLANITWLCMSSLRRSKIASPMIALIWSRRGGWQCKLNSTLISFFVSLQDKLLLFSLGLLLSKMWFQWAFWCSIWCCDVGNSTSFLARLIKQICVFGTCSGSNRCSQVRWF